MDAASPPLLRFGSREVRSGRLTATVARNGGREWRPATRPARAARHAELTPDVVCRQRYHQAAHQGLVFVQV
ncbi:hypothetical protein CSOJ01_13324 [Colletotrichum sojae]|uniref:Uncharacterized protein n=1 Tax=Colletotrichum sojae TaxID=2175907 RepID=A0A8H6IT23_9PEZI|nr:hypothetical protein CSOJ01_13324 [Colletotrichum sojae]